MQFDFLVDWLCFTINQSLLEVAIVIFSSQVMLMLSYILLMYSKTKILKEKRISQIIRLLRINCSFRTILTPIVGLLTGLRTQETL